MVGDLTDAQWEAIRPLLPPQRGRGRPRADDRRTLNGILYVLRTGCRWEGMPRRYGGPVTCRRRLRRWQREGVWERLWRAYLALLERQWTQAFPDGTFVPAKRGGEAVGVTKRGKRSKLMLVTEGQGLPIEGMVAGAQPAEIRLAEATLRTVRVPRQRGRPRTRPQVLVADKGYDSDAFRQSWRHRGIRPCIPRRRHQHRRGRKPDLSPYRSRWMVERTFSWLGHFRRLVVRYERSVDVYWAFVVLAFILIGLERILK
jgi:transposase